ncbi:MAG: hypothetical protein JXR91_08220 [Deltaproteobacteria bacterium]|nr:hypothetical protein [Deltaproteobacteria bacterium]
MKASKKIGLLSVVIITICLSCSRQIKTEKSVLVYTSKNDENHDPLNNEDNKESPIDDLVKRDAKKAASILNDALNSEDEVIAAYGAVFIKFLGIVHDEEPVWRAIIKGAQSENCLIAALSLRWIVEDKIEQLTNINIKTTCEEAKLFYKIGLLASNGDDGESKNYFCSGSVERGYDTMDNVKILPLAFGSIDNGPLSDAVAFIAARRDSLGAGKNDNKTPLSISYREKLFEKFNVKIRSGQIDSQNICIDTKIFDKGELIKYVESPFLGYPVDMLRAMCVKSSGLLQLTAVRVLGAKTEVPLSGDFAAAAAVMESKMVINRIEGAKTYLLLVARALKK